MSLLRKIHDVFGWNKSVSPIRKNLRYLKSDKADELCLEVLKKYNVGMAEVTICIDKFGVARYLINEPFVDETLFNAYNQIMEHLYSSYFNLESLEDVRKAVNRVASQIGLNDVVQKYYDVLMYYIIRDSRGYGILDVVLKDDNIEDVELSDWRKPITVVHRDFLSYEALVTNIQFQSEEEAKSYIDKLAMKCGKAISYAKPELHGTLPEGFRIAATIGDPVSSSPTFSIRKLPGVPIDIVKLVKQNVLNYNIASLIWLINDAKLFYVIAGGSGSGKTTLLNAFLQLSNPNWKIVVVQDVPEIKLPLRPRFMQFYGEDSDELLQRCFTALRYRPDILVVGEVRGREITALVRAIASGSGSATTFHASTPDEYELAIRGLLPRDLYTMLSLNTALMVFISRVRKGYNVERKVWKIYERVGDEWREIYDMDKGDSILKSYIIKRLAKRLARDDIEAEYDYRIKVLENAGDGYESIERILKRYYGL
ncbi:MAG: type II/IV secretion system ATPase subunit [Ignisphaera sp.]